ncbi:MAG: glycosyltransferase [Novosphingobium sp.]|nr:glycosyltransferase [Novosphingobium sp.]
MNAQLSGTARKGAVFRSVDSRPRGFAEPVSVWRVPSLLLTFCLLVLGQRWFFGTGALDWVFPQRDYVFALYEGQHSIAVRTYVISFYISFALFASGDAKARTLFAIDLVLRFFVICCLLDFANTAFLTIFGEPYPLTVVQIIGGLIGFGLFSLMLLERGTMPEPVPVISGPQNNLRMVLRLLATGTVAGALSAVVGFSDSRVIEELRELTLLGGIGPGVILFLPLLFLQLYVIALIERKLIADKDFAAPVSIIVPAYNEQYIIGETIRHIDIAAGHYGQPVELIILNNNSNDRTDEVAQTALDEAEHLTGRVIFIERPGKAHALNRGIQEASNPITIRIDADTLVGEDNISLAVQNFADPEVGVVGGVPLPPGGALFDRARLVEVMVKHGYYSPALSALWGLVGVPGMFAAYRTGALKQVGRFAHGMNGEDTDMSLRIGELGLRAMVDHRVRYVSEVPATFAHMREQRLRWFRSVYHVSSRCRQLIVGRGWSIRGKLILPYMLLNSARRAMMVPILLFGIFQFMTDTNPDTPLIWQAIIAVLVGAPFLVAVFAILVNGRPGALLALPEYLAFRALRAWFTLESVLTIPLNSTATLLNESSLVPAKDPV